MDYMDIRIFDYIGACAPNPCVIWVKCTSAFPQNKFLEIKIFDQRMCPLLRILVCCINVHLPPSPNPAEIGLF